MSGRQLPELHSSGDGFALLASWADAELLLEGLSQQLEDISALLESEEEDDLLLAEMQQRASVLYAMLAEAYRENVPRGG